MLQTSTITQKGQITIPVAFRREFGFLPKEKVLIFKEEDGIKIKPAEDFFSLYGSVKPRTRPENFKKMRKEFIKYLAKKPRHL